MVLYKDATMISVLCRYCSYKRTFLLIPRWINICAWCVAVGLLRTVCFCVMAVMTAITPSV